MQTNSVLFSFYCLRLFTNLYGNVVGLCDDVGCLGVLNGQARGREREIGGEREAEMQP